MSYKWHYNQDEAYIVLSGEGFMTDENGVVRRLKGDSSTCQVGFFLRHSPSLLIST